MIKLATLSEVARRTLTTLPTLTTLTNADRDRARRCPVPPVDTGAAAFHLAVRV